MLRSGDKRCRRSGSIRRPLPPLIAVRDSRMIRYEGEPQNLIIDKDGEFIMLFASCYLLVLY